MKSNNGITVLCNQGYRYWHQARNFVKEIISNQFKHDSIQVKPMTRWSIIMNLLQKHLF